LPRGLRCVALSVAHVLYGSALVSAVNSDRLPSVATLCRTPLSRTAAANLLASYFSRPKAVESRCVCKAAGRAGKEGPAPLRERCSSVSKTAAHGGRPVATDLPVAAPADARDRNASSCKHTRPRARTQPFHPATRPRRGTSTCSASARYTCGYRPMHSLLIMEPRVRARLRALFALWVTVAMVRIVERACVARSYYCKQ